MKENEPTIKHTEFLDGDGNVFASVFGIANIHTDGNRGVITKRTIWSDGAVTMDTGVIYRTKGIPTRPDLESEKDESKVDILKVS